MPSAKFRTLADLAPIIAEKKRLGQRIALANGGFDLLHIGHLRYLQEARALADVLVVALNSDNSLRQLKGSLRPLIDERGRVAILCSLACVDWITLFDELRVDNVLRVLQPDFHCKGADYTAETVPERAAVLAYGGRIAIVGGAKVRSTSAVLASIRQRLPLSPLPLEAERR